MAPKTVGGKQRNVRQIAVGSRGERAAQANAIHALPGRQRDEFTDAAGTAAEGCERIVLAERTAVRVVVAKPFWSIGVRNAVVDPDGVDEYGVAASIVPGFLGNVREG